MNDAEQIADEALARQLYAQFVTLGAPIPVDRTVTWEDFPLKDYYIAKARYIRRLPSAEDTPPEAHAEAGEAPRFDLWPDGTWVTASEREAYYTGWDRAISALRTRPAPAAIPEGLRESLVDEVFRLCADCAKNGTWPEKSHIRQILNGEVKE